MDHARCDRRHDSLARGSLLFKLYVANFTDYEGSYGAVGGVIVVLLWFYVSGIAILTGAELNAEIEHASPYGKAPGQKNANGKLLIGARAHKHSGSGSSGELTSRSVDLMVSAKARIGRGGGGCHPDDEVVESAWRSGIGQPKRQERS